ncbi:hypothetical protein KVP10_09550 [Candidimonas humi]|uniref:DUF4405 domain-containing protein n=1 Tax=Candidimonas humi TaxID=683355 RepID=A0ABV8NW34_9BURK|nr:hypothetical protein [Candidimonas humi]MBV6305131.1 hypothetical protein [Candidimonas humi]
MKNFLNRYATPLTTGFFIVSTISGVALFFHWQSSTFHSMHVWLSMVWLLPFVFHVWKNWNALVAYARRKTLVIPIVFSIVVALPFAYSGATNSRRGGNPAFQAAALMTQARVADLAPVLKTTPDALIASLKNKGYQAESADQTLAAIATSAGKPPTEVLRAVLPARQR